MSDVKRAIIDSLCYSLTWCMSLALITLFSVVFIILPLFCFPIVYITFIAVAAIVAFVHFIINTKLTDVR